MMERESSSVENLSGKFNYFECFITTILYFIDFLQHYSQQLEVLVLKNNTKIGQ